MLLQTGKYILAKIAIISSTCHQNAAGTSLDRKGVKNKMSFAPTQISSSLRGAIGQRVRLLSPNRLVTERLVVQAHPGTTIFPVFSYLIFFFRSQSQMGVVSETCCPFFLQKNLATNSYDTTERINVQGAGTLFQSTLK